MDQGVWEMTAGVVVKNPEGAVKNLEGERVTGMAREVVAGVMGCPEGMVLK